MKYVVNWIPLRIRVRSRNTQPHLKLPNFFSKAICFLSCGHARQFLSGSGEAFCGSGKAVSGSGKAVSGSGEAVSGSG